MPIARDDLIRQLNTKRESLGLSHTAFAKLLDMAQEDWAQIRSGKRNITLGQADLVKDKWPDLTTPVIRYVFEQGRKQRERKIEKKRRAA